MAPTAPQNRDELPEQPLGTVQLGGRRGACREEPARALKVAAPPGSGKSRLPFSTDQLTRIFNAPLYVSAEGDSEIRAGRFWVPLLSVWTGMRLNECVQLRTEDVAVLDGVDVILIREDDEGDKRLKTNASERFVPIRSELKKIGFLTYVAKMKRAEAVRLFPELPKGKRGYYSDPFQKWFSRFLASIGAKTPKTSFHSFRHCYCDALWEADISTERVRALSAPSHSHDSSGTEAPSLMSNPATPAKAGANGKSGSRPSPGKRGGDVELRQLNESVH